MRKWDSSLYDQKHAFVFKYGEELVGLLSPKAGERILDIGCGTGHLTKAIALAGADVTGIDNSPEMIDSARVRYPEIDFQVADAADFDLGEPFDAIFSNAALHWVRKAEEAVAAMSRALKPGGRLLVEFGGRGNVKRLYTALERAIRTVGGVDVQASNYFPSIGEYAGLLERYGVLVRNASLFDRFTRLEDGELGLRNWITMFRGELLKDFTEVDRERIFQLVESETRDSLFMDGNWFADYRRLRISAVKED